MFLRTSNGLMVSQTKLTERLIMRPATFVSLYLFLSLYSVV
jgi:hypothetical protein